MSLLRLSFLLALVTPTALAAPPPRAAAEIDYLITSLGRSGCDFQRNGIWYQAPKAEDHLRRKYEWLRDRNKAATAEQFIEGAGTRSSMSGLAYHVRCPGRPVVDSADWLRDRLHEMRGRDVRGH
ncbi:DUF5329 family protein [Lysobacter tyrosinilyticus]